MGIQFVLKDWHKKLFFILVALAPSLVLLIRGTVWGADSFAFWLTSCGNSTHLNQLSSPDLFIYFIQNFINCNMYQLALIIFILYSITLLAFWIIGNRFFGESGWRLPIYVGSLTPLFFIEALRFENDFFGWTLAFISVGLIVLALNHKRIVKKGLCLILALSLALFSIYLWLPSIIILLMLVLFLRINFKVKQLLILIAILAFILLQYTYLLRSFDFENIIAEELPFVGLIFIIHIIHFWKRIPKKFKLYSLFLIILGTLKSKFMFLATPLLLVGVIDKQLKEKIILKREIFGIKEIPVLYICGILLIGYFLMGINLYPTQNDLNDMKKAIQIGKDKNLALYNDWGDGWTFTYLGYETKYKIAPPNPDWNSLSKPFLAWSKQDLDCNLISKNLWLCDLNS